jgi:hypothetical protein
VLEVLVSLILALLLNIGLRGDGRFRHASTNGFALLAASTPGARPCPAAQKAPKPADPCIVTHPTSPTTHMSSSPPRLTHGGPGIYSCVSPGAAWGNWRSLTRCDCKAYSHCLVDLPALDNSSYVSNTTARIAALASCKLVQPDQQSCQVGGSLCVCSCVWHAKAGPEGRASTPATLQTQ